MLVLSPRKFNNKQEVLSELEQKTLVAVDTESDPTDDTFLGLAIAWSPQDAVWFTAYDPDLPLDFLSRVPIIFQNCLWDIEKIQDRYAYHRVSIQLHVEGDTMLLAQSCGYAPSLSALSFPFNFSHRAVTSLLYDGAGSHRKVEVMGKKKMKKVNMRLQDAPINDVGTICCEHAQATYKIWMELSPRADKSYHLDMSLTPTLISMHRRGIRVDTQLAQIRYMFKQNEVEQLRAICREHFGFNPGSPKQIGIALSKEGFSTRFTEDGNMVTDEEALLPLMNKSSIVPLVLMFRERSKLASTYFKPLCDVDRVHPRYHIVRTGRFATEDPTVQNIPEKQRDLYLPDYGEWFWDADAHQIEPVIMAHLSGDKQMLADIQTGDFYLPIANRYRIQRYTAKQLVLASSYEAGADKLVETAHAGRGGIRDNLSYDDAKQLLNQYYADYRRFKEWKDEVKRQAAVDGGVYTMLGRFRSFESMMEGEASDYEPLLKVVNTKIQGTGAEILKLGMKRLTNRNISLTCHDEILVTTSVDIPADSLDNLCPIPVHWKIKRGGSWGTLS